MGKSYSIDACALIAFFHGEVGGEKLKELFINPENNFCIHSINVSEVYYDFLKRSNKEDADAFLEDCKKLPIEIIWNINEELLMLASQFKTKYKISIADSYFLAIAQINKATPISTDHHEFDILEKNNEFEFFWLR